MGKTGATGSTTAVNREPTCTKTQKRTQKHGRKTQLLCKAAGGWDRLLPSSTGETRMPSGGCTRQCSRLSGTHTTIKVRLDDMQAHRALAVRSNSRCMESKMVLSSPLSILQRVAKAAETLESGF